MQIKDNGIVLSLQRIQESAALIKLFSETHGLCSGIIKNIDTRQNKNIYFPSNLVSFVWKARLAEHAGSLQSELLTSNSSIFMLKYTNLLAINSIFSLIGLIFKEREHVDSMFDYIKQYVENVKDEGINIVKYFEFELFILNKAGFSLDMSGCAITGSNENLAFISPKSGKAVSKAAAEPYEDKLLKLPAFLLDTNITPSKEEISDAFKLTNYFFERYIFIHIYNKNYLRPRENFINYILQ